MGKYVENPKYTSKALFEELFNRKKVLLRDRGDLQIINEEVEQVNAQIVELIQQEVAQQPVVSETPVVEAPVQQPVETAPVVPAKPKRAPYSGVGPKAYHISRNKKGEWQIKATGEKEPLIAFKEFERIVGFSKVLADKNGATVRLHDEKGNISTLY